MKKLSLRLLTILLTGLAFTLPVTARHPHNSQFDNDLDNFDNDLGLDDGADDLDSANDADLVAAKNSDPSAAAATKAEPTKAHKKHKKAKDKAAAAVTAPVIAGPVPTSTSMLNKAAQAARQAGAATSHAGEKRLQEVKAQLESVLATVQKALGELANSKAGEAHMDALNKELAHPALKDHKDVQ